MTVVLVDSGAGPGGTVNMDGNLSWITDVFGLSDVMVYTGSGDTAGNISFTDDSEYWDYNFSGNQFIQVQWNFDYGVNNFDAIASLYLSLDSPGNTSCTGYTARFYNDGFGSTVQVYQMFDAFSYSPLVSGFAGQIFVGDTLAFSHDLSSGDMECYINGTPVGIGTTDTTFIGGYIGFGTYGVNATLNNIYMDIPGGGGGPWTILPTGIPTSQAFGTPTIKKLLSATGIASGQAMGAPTVRKSSLPTGIASGQALGVPQLNKVMSPSGIPSGQAFGIPTIIGGAGAGAPIGRDLPLRGAGT